MAGLSFQQMADALGYTDRSSARTAYLTALSRANGGIDRTQQREDYRDLHVQRLERMIRADWAIAVGGTPLPDGTKAPPSFPAQEQILRMMQRQSALLGLDAPRNLVVITDDSKSAMLAMLGELEDHLTIEGETDVSALEYPEHPLLAGLDDDGEFPEGDPLGDQGPHPVRANVRARGPAADAGDVEGSAPGPDG